MSTGSTYIAPCWQESLQDCQWIPGISAVIIFKKVMQCACNMRISPPQNTMMGKWRQWLFVRVLQQSILESRMIHVRCFRPFLLREKPVPRKMNQAGKVPYFRTNWPKSLGDICSRAEGTEANMCCLPCAILAWWNMPLKTMGLLGLARVQTTCCAVS